MKDETPSRRSWIPMADATRTYLAIAVTLLGMLGVGMLAIQSGAIDALNASQLLETRGD